VLSDLDGGAREKKEDLSRRDRPQRGDRLRAWKRRL